MKTTPIVTLVWGLAYFAKVSGLLNFTWTEFLLPLGFIVLWHLLLGMLIQSHLKSLPSRLSEFEKALKERKF
jgi:uncharacterized integral membrane protein